jgi:hypothetical protein
MKTGLLITGCGRSGTGFMSKIFEAVGVPSGHEVSFNPIQHVWPWVGVESSWLAAPFLEQLLSSVHVVHQVRHPLAVIRSFMSYGFFDQLNDYVNFCYRHAPEICEWPDPLDRCIQYWISWNEMVEKHNVPCHRVEDLSALQLVEMSLSAGFEVSEKAFEVVLRKWIDAKVGHLHTLPLRSVAAEELLARPLGQKLQEVAGRYGYALG